jgi:hypothetical protein
MKAKQPARMIEGVIQSAGGGSSGSADWDLVLFLTPWREAGGPLVKRQVRLVVPIGKKAALDRALAQHRAGAAVAVAVSELEKQKKYLWWSAFGIPPLRSTDPTPFQGEVKRQAKRRVTHDDTLGELVLDRGMGWYEGTRRIGRGSYSVAVLTDEPDDDKKVARAIAAAGPRVVALEKEWGAILDAVTDELLASYNGKWRQGGRPLSTTAFKKQLRPSEIHVAADRTTLYLSSGKLFAEHGVEVRIPHRGKRREILIS